MMTAGEHARLEDQIRDWAVAVASDIPPGDATSSYRPAPAKRRAPRALAAAIVVVVAVRSAGVLVRLGRDDAATVAATSVAVMYERSEYRTDVSGFTCPDGNPPTGGYDGPIVFEAWSDRAGKRWKNVVTYPDGAVRSV